MKKILEKVETKMTEPRVTFGLWAMLSFLLTLGAISVGFLYAEGRETKQVQREVIQRVAVLEAQYGAIMKNLDRVITSVDKINDKLDDHRTAVSEERRRIRQNEAK